MVSNESPAGRVNSVIVAANLDKMYSARREFINTESNEKISRAHLQQIKSDEMEGAC